MTDILFAIAVLKLQAVFLEQNKGFGFASNENGDIIVVIKFVC